MLNLMCHNIQLFEMPLELNPKWPKKIKKIQKEIILYYQNQIKELQQKFDQL